MSRATIPRQLEREVLVEAGHRCAIPTCHQVPVEIAHIIPWEKVREHTFDNLIALCPTCHARYDRGEIDLTAMLQYKANLSTLNGRYGDLEQRVLRFFAKSPRENVIYLPGGLDILLMNLLEDHLIEDWGPAQTLDLDTLKTVEAPVFPAGLFSPGIPAVKEYKLTSAGTEFIRKWLGAERLK